MFSMILALALTTQMAPAGTTYYLVDSSGVPWFNDNAAWLKAWVRYVDAQRATGGSFEATPEAIQKAATEGGYFAAAPAEKSTSGDSAESATAQPAAPTYYGDPYGFTGWLNGVRAQYGLGAVGYDANLEAWAAVNNGQQHARGLGHHVMGTARRQNAGTGAAATVWQMWMASPAHAAALLDPTITMIGIAASGSYWTFNAY